MGTAYEILRKIYRTLQKYKLRVSFGVKRFVFKEEFITFRCNICGNIVHAPLSRVSGREFLSCYYCLSSLRFRAIINVLSLEVFGKSLAIPDFPESKEIVGIGMSDADVYANALCKRFSYKNTYYHKEPRFDVTSPVHMEMENSLNFIISSEVFEHILPPVEAACRNLYKLLKNNGVCIFSVPYVKDGTMKEHFPDLYDFNIVERNGKKIMVNKTRNGSTQFFDDLRFHGGKGATLEMRVFSENSLREYFTESGFSELTIHSQNNLEYGIVWKGEDSFPMSMRKRN